VNTHPDPDQERELLRIRSEASTSTEDELIGSTLAHYRVLERIGAGGMGVVYRGRDERLRRDVALKVLRSDRLRDETAERALLHEARLACSIMHPNVAAIYDVGEVGGHTFFAMEYVEGRTLSEFLRQHALPPKTAIDYGVQIASALEAAHEAGIVHRDLKSLNVRVTPTGLIKVLDFGLSIRSASTGAKAAANESTSPYIIAGTIPYMAPEAIRGERPDARGDIWSLGVTLFEMLSGRLPFHGAARAELEDAILHQDPAPLPPHISPPLRRVIDRCLRKEPSRRYQRAGEIRAAVEAIRDAAVPRRRWPVVAGVVGAVIVTCALLLWGGRVGRRAAEPGLLAVFPIRNASGVPDQQFLADGLTDQLINTFAQLSPIPIMSRASSATISRTGRPLPQLAQQYNIALVLEASSVRLGDRVRVDARLIDAKMDRSIWAESYERPMEEIMSLDREIARSVAARLQAPLSVLDRQRLDPPPPVDLGAYRAYVQGRGLAADREYGRALEYFEEAARSDSGFAGAYAGEADCYTEMLYYGEIAPLEGIARADAAATRALELGATQASPHLALAFLYGIQWDWERTDRELLEALRDEPGSAEVWYRRSMYLGVLGQTAAQVATMERAVQLDPLSVRFAVELGLAYLNAGRVADAAKQFEVVMERDHGGEGRRARAYAARCLALQGRAREAVAMLEGTGGHSGSGGGFGAATEIFEKEELAYALAVAGQADAARHLITSLTAPRSRGPASPLAIAAAQIGLGDHEAAFATLSRAVAEREPRIVWVQVDQRFGPIRGDPRYAKLLRSMGLDRAGSAKG